MAWSDGQTLGARFEQAGETAGDLHWHWTLSRSDNGLTKTGSGRPRHCFPLLTVDHNARCSAEPAGIAGT